MNESQAARRRGRRRSTTICPIILDLAIGGGYPDGVCGCTTPTGATISGGTMSVAYVAAYESTGATLGPTGPITGYDGLCVDDQSASTANYNPVQVYTCNGTDAQQWTFDTANDTLQVLGMCMDISGGGTADGTLVDLYYCNGSGAQVWQPQATVRCITPSQASVSTTRTGPRRLGRSFRSWTAAATRTSNGACHEGSLPPQSPLVTSRSQPGLRSQDCGGGTSQQPLVRTLQRPAEHVAGSEQAIDAVVVGDDPAG